MRSESICWRMLDSRVLSLMARSSIKSVRIWEMLEMRLEEERRKYVGSCLPDHDVCCCCPIFFGPASGGESFHQLDAVVCGG
jgi:hypothetical protein